MGPRAMSGPAVVWVNGRLEPAGKGLAQRHRPRLSARRRGIRDLPRGRWEVLSSCRSTRAGSELGGCACHRRFRTISKPSCRRAIAQVCAANGWTIPGSKVGGPGNGESRTGRPGVRLLPPGAEAQPERCRAGVAGRSAGVRSCSKKRPQPGHLRACVATPSSPLARVKTTSRAEFVYARLEAHHRGADDALLLTTDGHLAEATSASIFLVEASGLATPSLDCGILVSTTRGVDISSPGAPGLGLAVRRGRLVPGGPVRRPRRCFASSVAGIVPVTSLEGKPVGGGSPGTVANHLRAAPARQWRLSKPDGPRGHVRHGASTGTPSPSCLTN